MSRLTQLMESPTVAPPDTVNHEGFPAYTPSAEDALVELLVLGTLGNTFYVSDKELLAETVKACQQFATTNPRFLAQTAVFARTQGFVRSAPLLAVVALLSGPAEAQGYGRKIFDSIVRTAADVREIVAIAQSGHFRQGYGGLVRRLVSRWLTTHLTPYQAIKYAGAGNKLSLRNILRLTHPTPLTPEQDALFDWLVHKTVRPSAPSMVQWVQRLESGEVSPASAIREGQLPFEAVMPRVDAADASVWSALSDHAPYFFLLRSLNAMHRAGVWNDPAAIQRAVEILTDRTRIQKAMLFPFRYYTAIANSPQLPQALLNALYTALDYSLENVPVLGDLSVAIAPDVSGSMGVYSVAKGTSAAAIAGIFTAALWKRNPTATVLPFGRRVHTFPGNPRDSIMSIGRSISGIYGGGTDLSVPIQLLAENRQVVDLFIGLTDSEDWAASYAAYWEDHTFLETWRIYKRQIAPHAKAVLIQLVPTQKHVAPSQEPDVFYVYGWSDQVLQYIASVVQGHTMVDQIRQIPV